MTPILGLSDLPHHKKNVRHCIQNATRTVLYMRGLPPLSVHPHLTASQPRFVSAAEGPSAQPPP